MHNKKFINFHTFNMQLVSFFDEKSLKNFERNAEELDKGLNINEIVIDEITNTH